MHISGLFIVWDRPTGGVMVFAKTSKAAARLSRQMQQNQMQKTYLLRCEKAPLPLSGTMEDYLRKDRDQMVRVVPADTAGAQACRPTLSDPAYQPGWQRMLPRCAGNRALSPDPRTVCQPRLSSFGRRALWQRRASAMPLGL